MKLSTPLLFHKIEVYVALIHIFRILALGLVITFQETLHRRTKIQLASVDGQLRSKVCDKTPECYLRK